MTSIGSRGSRGSRTRTRTRRATTPVRQHTRPPALCSSCHAPAHRSPCAQRVRPTCAPNAQRGSRPRSRAGSVSGSDAESASGRRRGGRPPRFDPTAYQAEQAKKRAEIAARRASPARPSPRRARASSPGRSPASSSRRGSRSDAVVRRSSGSRGSRGSGSRVSGGWVSTTDSLGNATRTRSSRGAGAGGRAKQRRTPTKKATRRRAASRDSQGSQRCVCGAGRWCLCWRRKCSLGCPGGVSDCVPVRPFGRSISDTAPFGAPTGSLLNGGAPAADAGASAAASEPAGGYQRRSVDASLFDDGLDLDRRLKLVEGKLNQAAREASL